MKVELFNANKPTINGRVYTKEVLQSVIEDPIIKEKLSTQSLLVKSDSSQNVLGYCRSLELSEDKSILYANIVLIPDDATSISRIYPVGKGYLKMEGDKEVVQNGYSLDTIVGVTHD